MRKHSAGFTLIELMVVIVIIGVLSVAGMVSFRKASESARNGKRAADQSTIQQALQLYKVDNGTYPVYLQSADANVLKQNYENMQNDLQAGSYLSEDINDPYLTQTNASLQRQYWYYSNAAGTTYNVCYQKEPGLITIICKTNP